MGSALQELRRVVNRGADADVSRAAAEIAVHRKIDVAIAWPLDLFKQSSRAHDLSRLTVSALGHITRDPRLLDRFGLTTGHSLDRRDLAVAHAGHRHRT